MRNFVKRHPRLTNLLLSIVIAFSVWFYVINTENPEGSTTLREIPVQLQGIAVLEEKGYVVTDVSTSTVSLHVSGKKRSLMRMNKRNVSLIVDVSAISNQGEFDILGKASFPAYGSDSVSVTSQEDLTITVTVQAQEDKLVPVVGTFSGTTAEGYMAGSVTFPIESVSISGASQDIVAVSYAEVSATGNAVSETFSQSVEVVLKDSAGNPVPMENILLGTRSMTVVVPVCKVVEIPLSVTLVAGGGADSENTRCVIKPSSIMVRQDSVTGGTPDEISLGTIDLSRVYADTAFSFPITLPEGFVGWNMPEAATVRISFPKLKTKWVTVNRIALVNASIGIIAEPVNQSLQVLVRGTPEAVNALEPEKISVTADISEAVYGGGVQRFRAEVVLDDEVSEDVGIIGSEYRVSVTVS